MELLPLDEREGGGSLWLAGSQNQAEISQPEEGSHPGIVIDLRWETLLRCLTQIKPLASHGTPWQHSKILRHCDT